MTSFIQQRKDLRKIIQIDLMTQWKEIDPLQRAQEVKKDNVN